MKTGFLKMSSAARVAGLMRVEWQLQERPWGEISGTVFCCVVISGEESPCLPAQRPLAHDRLYALCPQLYLREYSPRQRQV
jgi:hypothetical protein